MGRPKSKAAVTWLGEDHLHVNAEGEPARDPHGNVSVPPNHTIWRGIKFPKGEPVEVTDKHIIAKAKANHFFDVDGVRAEVEAEDDAE